jgi:hypothetical protein
MGMRTLFFSAMTAAAVLSTGAQAATFTITQADFTEGGILQNFGGFTLSGVNGSFTHRTLGGVTAVGIGGGSVSGEIDGNEAINISTAPLYLTSFTIAFLYPNGVYADVGNESAFIVTSAGNITLQTTGETTATVTSGTVENLAPGNAGATGGGEWRVSGLSLLTSLVSFQPGNAGGQAAFGDYALVDVTFSDVAPGVPEASTWAMMLLGFAGIGFAAYRRSRKNNGLALASA